MKSLSFIGMSKNSGKTTALNHVLAYLYRNKINVGLTSVGRDGEDKDVLTKKEKPKIVVQTGTMFATTTELLKVCAIQYEQLHQTGINTPLGEVLILLAKTDGAVQLCGPSSTLQTAVLREYLHSLGAQIVIVDGAFGRKTIASTAVTENTILCTGAALSPDMNRVVSETMHTYKLLMTEKAGQNVIDCLQGSALALVSESGDITTFDRVALTNELVNGIIETGASDAAVIVKDASKLLISELSTKKLQRRGIRILVRESICLQALTVNPFSPYGYEFDAEMFKETLSEKVNIPVINVVRDSEALYEFLTHRVANN